MYAHLLKCSGHILNSTHPSHSIHMFYLFKQVIYLLVQPAHARQWCLNVDAHDSDCHSGGEV